MYSELSEEEKNKYGCFIENYISDNYSICREERQYALYLHNILMKYRTKETRRGDKVLEHIFSVCGLTDANIEHVFYEATFMRDFFMRNRQLELSINNNLKEELTRSPIKSRKDNRKKPRFIINDIQNSFNAKLLDYEIKQKGKGYHIDKTIEEIDYGHNEVDKKNTIHNGLPSKDEDADFWIDIQRMMNAKPDLAVVYYEKGIKYLLFIECKFESKVSGQGDGSQDRLQYRIAEFLCENFLKGITVSTAMQDSSSSMVVWFDRKENSDRDVIEIKDLIDYNARIFEQTNRI